MGQRLELWGLLHQPGPGDRRDQEPSGHTGGFQMML